VDAVLYALPALVNALVSAEAWGAQGSVVDVVSLVEDVLNF
jgi:hypothetical protein